MMTNYLVLLPFVERERPAMPRASLKPSAKWGRSLGPSDILGGLSYRARRDLEKIRRLRNSKVLHCRPGIVYNGIDSLCLPGDL